MRRRRVLHALAGGAVPGAGCTLVGRSPEASQGPPTGTARETDGESTVTATPRDAGPFALGETVPVDGIGDVSVESVVVQRSVIHARTWREVYEPEGAQMLVVEASVEGDGHDHRGLSFDARLDRERVGSAVRVPLASDGTRYALSVPVGSVEEAIVVLQATGRPAWVIPERARGRLAAAPEFHLQKARVREDDGRTVLDLAVENAGEQNGTFRGIVSSKHTADADAAVRFPVPVGETVTETVRNSIVQNWGPEDDFEHDVTPETRRFAVGYA